MDWYDAVGPLLILSVTFGLGVFAYVLRRRKVSRQRNSSDLSKTRALSRYRESRLQILSCDLNRLQEHGPISVRMEVVHGGEQLLVSDLDEVFKTSNEQVILLAGDSGAGKTSLLKQFEKQLHQGDNLIPIYIELCTFPKDEQIDLFAWITSQWQLLVPKGPTLEALITEGKVCLLLDGLNEMSYGDDLIERFRACRQMIETFQQPNRMIISCRSSDIQDVLPIQRVDILPISQELVQSYVNKCCEAISLPAESFLRVNNRFKDSSIAELYNSPLKLTLLFTVLKEFDVVPEDIGHLYSKFVLASLVKIQNQDPDHWNKIRELCSESELNIIHQYAELPTPHQETPSSLIGSLGLLAFRLQKESPGAWVWPQDRHIEGILGSRWKTIIEAASDLGIVEKVSGAQVVQFRYKHHQLQEYFAARAWVRDCGREGGSFAARPYRIDDPKMNSLSTTVYCEKNHPLLQTQKMPQRTVSGWGETISMAMSLTGTHMLFVEELLAFDPVQVAATLLKKQKPQPGASEEQSKEFYKYKSMLRQALVGWILSDEVDLRAKVDAGAVLDTEALSLLGYKKGQTLRGYTYWLPPVVGFEASPEQEPNKGFEVSKYLLTYAEFDCFVAAGGYADGRYWSSIPEAKEVKEAFNSDAWLAKRNIYAPLQPVEDIHFHEAQAYTQWLSKASNRMVQLPLDWQRQRILDEQPELSHFERCLNMNIAESGADKLGLRIVLTSSKKHI